MKSLVLLLASGIGPMLYAKPETTAKTAAKPNKPATKTAAKPEMAETTGPKEDRSIIDPKYRDKYKDPDYKPDFVADLIDEAALTKSAEGKPEGLNPSLILDLAEKNGVPAESLANLRASIGKLNATGRIKMTVANMLRARAKRRHGLNDLQGKFVKTPSGFTVGDKTENPDGSKIAKPVEPKAATATKDDAKKPAKAA